MIDYTTILEAYTVDELLELNNRTPEEMVEFLVLNEFIKLPLVFE